MKQKIHKEVNWGQRKKDEQYIFKEKKMGILNLLLSVVVIFGLLIGGANFVQSEENGNDVINTIVEGYNFTLSKIKSGSCTATVTSTTYLPEGQTKQYKALHTLKFSGPYVRWNHTDWSKVTSADGRIIKETEGPSYDTYIDREQRICYGYVGKKRYEINSMEHMNPLGNPEIYRVMPQSCGRPFSLLKPKGITNKFINYEEIDGCRCALIESTRLSGKRTAIARMWIDTKSWLILKEEHWMQDNTSGNSELIYKSELEITLCDEKNNLFCPKKFKELRYYPNLSTGKWELREEKTISFENLAYNVDIKKDDLTMTIPRGAKVVDFTAGGIGYTVPE